MEYQKIANLIDNTPDQPSKCRTKSWVEINDESRGGYTTGSDIKFKTTTIWQELELASELESDLRDTVDLGKKWLVDFNAGKTQLVSFDRSNNNGYIDVKIDWSALEEKSSFQMLGLTFYSKLNWGFYIISIAKIGALIRSIKFLFPEVALYLYKSTILGSVRQATKTNMQD